MGIFMHADAASTSRSVALVFKRRMEEMMRENGETEPEYIDAGYIGTRSEKEDRRERLEVNLNSRRAKNDD